MVFKLARWSSVASLCEKKNVCTYFLLAIITAAFAFPPTAAAQYRRKTLLLPNIGPCNASHPELINWIAANGGAASNFYLSGDFFNVVHRTESNLLLGLALGGLFDKTKDSNLLAGYFDLMFGVVVWSTDRFQINMLAHGDALIYNIDGIAPPGVPIPPTDRYYMRGFTYGGGPSLQVQYILARNSDAEFGIGVECGATFIDPSPSWQFGYSLSTTTGTSRFYGTSVPGPNVDNMFSYVRFSCVVKF